MLQGLLLTPTNNVWHSTPYFISVLSFMRYKCWQEVTNDTGQKKIMYIGFKNKIFCENTNWFELDPSWIKRMAFDFVIKRALIIIYQYCRSTNTFYKQFH